MTLNDSYLNGLINSLINDLFNGLVNILVNGLVNGIVNGQLTIGQLVQFSCKVGFGQLSTQKDPRHQ